MSEKESAARAAEPETTREAKAPAEEPAGSREQQAGGGMPPEERARLHHVAPLGESRAPPAVVLGEGMVLGQIEGDDPFGVFLHTEVRLSSQK